MIRAWLLLGGACAAPAFAQAPMAAMPGMTMPMPAARPHAKSAPPAAARPPTTGAAHPAPPASASAAAPTPPVGDAAAPAPPTDHYADRAFGAAAMADARRRMMRDSGAQTLAQILFTLAEYQVRDGRDGYRWDGEGRFGGDVDRLAVKSEGSGTVRGLVEAAEVQALWSHATAPTFDLQAGVRHDVAPHPARTYATIGIEGLAPYMFETKGALFLSDRGELLARAEAWYDERITQRIVLQPRVELNLAAQDVRATRTGAGLVDAELGLRLRYEITRAFAPYVGVSYMTKVGRTATFARADGGSAASTGLVTGVRFWF